MNTPRFRLGPVLVAIVAAAASMPASALYKVVQPDGSVTYTDRPPSDQSARITPLNRGGAAGTAAAAGQAVALQTTNLPPLPPELRQPVQRHPVTLYAAPECAPCAEGRALLQQRGIPYSERRIESAEDVAAFERLSGGRTLPMLAVGEQYLRGYSNDWANFLEAAGYPRESRLPRNWPAATVTAMAPRAPAAPVAPATPTQPASPAPAVADDDGAPAENRPRSRIRF